MIVIALLCVLAFADMMLAAFRSAAGRLGRIDKRAHYVEVFKRASLWAVVLLAAHGALAALLTVASASPATTWAALLGAGERLVLVYGAFATVILAAFAFYAAPFAELQVLTTVIVLGPLTFARSTIIVGGLVYAALAAPTPAVIVLAASTGVTALAFEPAFGRRYRGAWRPLQRRSPG